MSLPNCKFNLQLRVSSGQNPDNQKLYVHICIYPKVQNSDITYTQYSNLNNFIIGDHIPKFMSSNYSEQHDIYINKNQTILNSITPYPMPTIIEYKKYIKYQIQQVIVLKCGS